MQDEKDNKNEPLPENTRPDTLPVPAPPSCGCGQAEPTLDGVPCCSRSMADACGHCQESSDGEDEYYLAAESGPPIYGPAAAEKAGVTSQPAHQAPAPAPAAPPLPANQKLVGVRFKTAGELYFVPDEAMELTAGERVVVKLAKGKDIAQVAVVSPPANAKITDPQIRIIRKVNKNDLIQEQQNQQREKEAFTVCLNKIKKLELPMKLLSVKYLFDGSRVTFYFKADSKVDFRKLVRELAFVFRTRIELRQIGPRDETELFGGLGICGRCVCCSYWNCRAKTVLNVDTQRTPFLNFQGMQGKVLGLCSRPLCCLRYEGDVPVVASKPPVPSVNSRISIDDQNGTVKLVDENANQVVVQIEGEEIDLNISYEDFLLKIQEGKVKIFKESGRPLPPPVERGSERVASGVPSAVPAPGQERAAGREQKAHADARQQGGDQRVRQPYDQQKLKKEGRDGRGDGRNRDNREQRPNDGGNRDGGRGDQRNRDNRQRGGGNRDGRPNDGGNRGDGRNRDNREQRPNDGGNRERGEHRNRDGGSRNGRQGNVPPPEQQPQQPPAPPEKKS